MDAAYAPLEEGAARFDFALRSMPDCRDGAQSVPPTTIEDRAHPPPLPLDAPPQKEPSVRSLPRTAKDHLPYAIIAAQLLERFAFTAVVAVLPAYLTRFPLLLSPSTTLAAIHVFVSLLFAFAFAAGVLLSAGVAPYAWSIGLAIVGVFGALGVVGASTITAIAQAADGRYVPGSTAVLAVAWIALPLVACAFGGLRTTLPILGSRELHSSGRDCKQRFFLRLWYAERVALAAAVVLVPNCARSLACLGDTSCYPLSYALAAAASLACLAVLAAFRQRPSFSRRSTAANAAFFAFQSFCPSAVTSAEESVSSVSEARDAHTLQTLRDAWRGFRDYRRARAGRPLSTDREAANTPAYAPPNMSPAFVHGCEAAVRALRVLAPGAVFAALYYQQASVWIFQAMLLDCTLWRPTAESAVRIAPETTAVARPLASMVMLPVIAGVVMPAVERMRGRTARPSSRMLSGLVLAGLAFVCSALLQSTLSAGEGDAPGPLVALPGAHRVWALVPQYTLMAAAEVLFAPGAVAYVMHGDGAAPARDGSGDARLVAVGYASAMASAAVGNALVAAAVLLAHPLYHAPSRRELLFNLWLWVLVMAAAIASFHRLVVRPR